MRPSDVENRGIASLRLARKVLAPFLAGVAYAYYRVAVADHVSVVLGGFVELVERVLRVLGACHVLGDFAAEACFRGAVVG